MTARTRLACLLGHPVAHSRSPEIHNAAFAATGFDAVYLAFDVVPAAVGSAVGGLRALRLLGANVTVPHKRAALGLADERTPEAAAVGAANTLFWDGDRLVADNTDASGLGTVLERDVGLAAGDAVALLGAGGAARAAAVALGRVGASVRVVARRRAAAEEVASVAAEKGAADAAAATFDEPVGPPPRLVLNATPLGWHGEALPAPFLRFTPDQVALDLVYGVDTPFLTAARAAGARGIDGLGMLVAQAGASFERWTGLPAPLDAMTAGVGHDASRG